MTMGARIRTRREELGLSQRELAEQAGLQLQTIWRYEHDEQVPKVDAIDRIATALRVTTDHVIRGDVPTVATDSPAE